MRVGLSALRAYAIVFLGGVPASGCAAIAKSQTNRHSASYRGEPTNTQLPIDGGDVLSMESDIFRHISSRQFTRLSFALRTKTTL